jgi:superfamily II DNA or RNA helicase
MNFNTLYTDFWELIAQYLDSDDLFNFSLVCKQVNHACKRPTIMHKISYPMKYPWRLTAEQRNVVQQMEKSPKRFKLVNGEVGSGKTMVSSSYAIRNYAGPDSDPDAKIVMCGPPNLVEMWWLTLRKYFGIEPAVFHGTNPKYIAKEAFKYPPEEKFIVISYIIFVKNKPDWFRADRDILIIDETHHKISLPHDEFKEIIGLSATTTTKWQGVATGIRQILNTYGVTMDECTFKLDKNVLSRALPPVVYKAYLLDVVDDIKQICKTKININSDGSYDMTRVQTICKILSHPFDVDFRTQFTSGYVIVNRKRFAVPIGNYTKYDETVLTINDAYLDPKTINEALMKSATFNINNNVANYSKYLQVYHIFSAAAIKGEKVVLFDQSVKYLPFLYQFLVNNGVNSYIFSTHYDITGRQRQLRNFKKDSKPAILLSSITMLGEGQNVTEANHVIFLTQCLDPNKYHQAIGRCWRYPQNKVTEVHLLYGTKFDQKVYEHACGVGDIKTNNWSELLHNNVTPRILLNK